MHLKFDKILTENPFVDELVYYTKILGFSTVLKDEQLALDNESKESLKAGELYVACVENKITYEILDYNEEVLKSVGISDYLIEECLEDKTKVPESLQNALKNAAIKYYIDNYVEKNNYYRMLNGLPDYGDPGLIVPEEYGYNLPDELIIDLSKPIHKMNDYEINVLESYGILDSLRGDYPKAKYLDFLGQYKISIYEARSADRFDPLYIDTVEATEVYDKYKECLLKNRQFILSTVYSEAYKYQSDFYDGFISSLIIIQTMTDIISEVQEFIARKEIFDPRSIRYLLASNNIPYYGDIPIKYQKALIKNIHLLLKYKSTDKNIIDICSLFGFDDINVFKYYILKQRLTDDNGNFIYGFREELDEQGMSHYVPDDAVAYDLKFVKVPLEENADNYIKSESSYVDYDHLTSGDWSWANEVDPSELKDEILRKEFNYVRSKYLSIENVYEASRLSFDIPYFFNLLFDNVKLEELLTITVHNITDSVSLFKLSDLFCYMISLTYLYNGLEDDILAVDQEKSLLILGFNFEADLQALNSYIIDQGFTLKELGVDGFTIPDTSILSMNQLVNIFINNKKCYENIIYGMRHAEDIHIYNIYKKLYDTLLLTKNTNEFFRLPNGEIPTTITEYLSYRDPALYKSIMDISVMGELEVMQKAIVDNITTIVTALDEYLDSDQFKYIYSNMPGVSSEFIKKYIVKLINFFKSYKVDLIGIDTVYKFDDKFSMWIKVIDGIMNTTVSKESVEFGLVRDTLVNKISKKFTDRVSPKSKLYLDIYTWVYWILSEENLEITDMLYSVTMTHLIDDYGNIKDDELEYYMTTSYDEICLVKDSLYEYIVNISKKDKISINDSIYTMIRSYIYDDSISIEDRCEFILSHDLASMNNIIDILSAKSNINHKEIFSIRDNVSFKYID